MHGQPHIRFTVYTALCEIHTMIADYSDYCLKNLIILKQPDCENGISFVFCAEV